MKIHNYILLICGLFLITDDTNAQPFSLDLTWSTGNYPGYTARTNGILIEKENDRILYWGRAMPINPPPSIARYK